MSESVCGSTFILSHCRPTTHRCGQPAGHEGWCGGGPVSWEQGQTGSPCAGLAADASTPTVSPEEHRRVQAEAAAYRDLAREFENELKARHPADPRFPMLLHVQAVLASSTSGTGYLSPTESADLRARLETAEQACRQSHATVEQMRTERTRLEAEVQRQQRATAAEVRRAVEEAVAQERAATLEIVRAYLHNVPAEPVDDLDRLASYSNGTVRRIEQAIRSRGKG